MVTKWYHCVFALSKAPSTSEEPAPIAMATYLVKFSLSLFLQKAPSVATSLARNSSQVPNKNAAAQAESVHTPRRRNAHICHFRQRREIYEQVTYPKVMSTDTLTVVPFLELDYKESRHRDWREQPCNFLYDTLSHFMGTSLRFNSVQQSMQSQKIQCEIRKAC